VLEKKCVILQPQYHEDENKITIKEYQTYEKKNFFTPDGTCLHEHADICMGDYFDNRCIKNPNFG
jgi:hypothetical protein